MKKETLLDIGEAVVNVAAELLKNKIERTAKQLKRTFCG